MKGYQCYLYCKCDTTECGYSAAVSARYLRKHFRELMPRSDVPVCDMSNRLALYRCQVGKQSWEIARWNGHRWTGEGGLWHKPLF
jgi:hypothetical protein